MSILLLVCVFAVALCASWVESASHDPLTHIYNTYDELEGFHHWIEYGSFTHHHVNKLRSLKKVNMLEIGVQSGGSSRVWDKYFADNEFTYLGVDINPPCKQFEKLPRIRVEIGSQADDVFLVGLCDQYGPFDLIVDDGGHTTNLTVASFKILFSSSCMKDGGVYMIEDTHTMSFWEHKKNMKVDGQNLFHYMADLQYEQIKYFKTMRRGGGLISGGGFPDAPSEQAKHILSMSIADSQIILHFRETWRPLTEFKKGKKFIGYGLGTVGN